MITESTKPLTKAQEQRAIRKARNLPARCECGGRMEYQVAFERAWGVCLTCTPVVRVRCSS
jgi:hypothetical protein